MMPWVNFQAEHGPDSQVVLVVSGDGVDLKAIEEEISKQCQSLPRGEIALKALSHSYTVLARDVVEVCPFILTWCFQAFINPLCVCCRKPIMCHHWGVVIVVSCIFVNKTLNFLKRRWCSNLIKWVLVWFSCLWQVKVSWPFFFYLQKLCLRIVPTSRTYV